MSSKERNPTIEIEKEIYDKLKDMAFDNRRKLKPFVNNILLEFVNQKDIPNSQKEKDRISNLEEKITSMMKQNEYSQMIIESTTDGMIQFIKEMFSDKLKEMPISQEFLKVRNLLGKTATSKQMTIYDDLLKKEIIVKIKNNNLICTYHESNTCEHIEYALRHVSFFFNLILNDVKIPQKELIRKNLEKIASKK